MPSTIDATKPILFDAGIFIGALLKGDPRHQEARPLVEAARRIHDARHAAAALVAGVQLVYTYDIKDWAECETDGLQIAGPASTLSQITKSLSPV